METAGSDVTKRFVTFQDLSGICGGSTTAALSNQLTDTGLTQNFGVQTVSLLKTARSPFPLFVEVLN